MILVRFYEREAVINNYEWSADDQSLADLLNAMLSPFGASGEDPYPDLTAAQDAVAKLGGEIVYIEPQSVEGGWLI